MRQSYICPEARNRKAPVVTQMTPGQPQPGNLGSQPPLGPPGLGHLAPYRGMLGTPMMSKSPWGPLTSQPSQLGWEAPLHAPGN